MALKGRVQGNYKGNWMFAQYFISREKDTMQITLRK